MFYLCRIYIDGKVVPQNLNLANEIIDEINDKKSSEYFLLLGKIEYKRRNYSAAKKYFKKSIKLNNAEAMYCYGQMLCDGELVKKDEKKSKKYLELARKNGYKELKPNYNYELESNESDESDGNNENEIISDKYSKYLKDKIKILAVGDSNYKVILLNTINSAELNRPFYFDVDNIRLKALFFGKDVNFMLWDTPNQEDIFTIRIMSYINTDIFLLVFGLTNKYSFKRIFDHWLPEVIQNTNIKPICFVIGLESEIWYKDPYNPDFVNPEELELASKNEHVYKIIKCSYITGQNIMTLINLKEFVEAIILVNYAKDKKKKKLNYISNKSYKYNFDNFLKIQVCCVGDNQSGIVDFLENFRRKNDDDKQHKLIEKIEDFSIAHMFDDKDVILKFSQRSFQDAVQLIRSENKPKTQVILLVFSLIHKETLKYLIDEWLTYLMNYKSNDIIFLVGVDKENWDPENPEFVNEVEVIEFARNIRAYKVVTCSYATGSRIEYLKNQITKSIVS